MLLLDSIKKNSLFLLYNLLSIIVFIGLLELLCTYYLNNPSDIPQSLRSVFMDYYRSYDRNIAQVTDCGHYNDELFYTLAPGTCTFENREFSTQIYANSKGIRDDESSLKQPDIVVIGDSFSMGWGVNQEDCYPSIMEGLLSGKNILNASISSYGTARELILLDYLQTNIPELILIQYHPSDYEENEEYASNNMLEISSKSTYDSLKKYIQSRNKYFPGKRISQLLKLKLMKSVMEKPRLSEKQEVDVFLQVLMNSPVNFENTQIIVFEIEHISTLNDVFINTLKNEINRREDLPEHLKNLQAISLSDLMIDSDFFILDDHLNSQGHKHLAQILYGFIQSSNIQI